MDCSVCTNTFGHDRRPHVLPCGHNFCLPCLTEIREKNAFLKCPDCRTEHHSTLVRDLPVNYGWESLAASLHLKEPSSTQRYDYPSCSKSEKSAEGICPDHEIPRVSWCMGCHAALCKECITLHTGDIHIVKDLQQAMEQIKLFYISNNAAFNEWLAALESLSKGLLHETKTVVLALEEIVPKIQCLQEKVWQQQCVVETATSVTELDSLVATALTESRRTHQPAALDHMQEAIRASEKLEAVMQNLKTAASTTFSCPTAKAKDAWKFDYDLVPSAPPHDPNVTLTCASSVSSELRMGCQHTASSTMVFGQPEVTMAHTTCAVPMHLHRGQKACLQLPTDLLSPYTTRITFIAQSTSSKFGIHYLRQGGMELFHLEVDFKKRHVKMYFSDHDGTKATDIRPFPFLVQRRTALDFVDQHDQLELKVEGQMVGVQRKSDFSCVCVEVREWDGVIILQELVVLEPSLPY